MLKAGVDPSQKKPHPDYKEHWKKVRVSYKLTRIVRHANDEHLDRHAQKKIQAIVDYCSHSALCRDLSCKTKKRYAWMMKFLMDFELSVVIEKRNELWKIR
jgi:hypothetical protein